MKSRLGVGGSDLLQLESDFWSGDRLDEVLMEYIQSLRMRFLTAILSNAWLDARPLFSDVFHFDVMVLSAEEGITKPADEIYLRTAERMDLKPWELLFVDDLLPNAQAAAKVGMAAIHYTDTPSAIRQIRTLLKSQGIVIPD